MRLIDEIHLEEPYLGSRGIKSALRIRGHKVAESMSGPHAEDGIEAIYKKPRLSKPHPGTRSTLSPPGLDITKPIPCGAPISLHPMARDSATS